MSTPVGDSGFGQNKVLVSVLLWGGALLAIAGLWWPNWIEALLSDAPPFWGLPIFRTPVISYLGYLILWLACILVVGIKDAASDYKAPGWVGLASVAIAITSSVLAQTGALPIIILLLFTIAAFLATLFVYWTMEKVTEIKSSLKRAVWDTNFIAFILGIAAVLVIPSSTVVLLLAYTMVGIYTLTWLIIALSVLPSHYRAMMEKRAVNKK